MEATLKFNLDNFDDLFAHRRCVAANDMASVLFELKHNVKRKVDWHIESTPDITPEQVSDYTFDLIQKVIEEHNINLKTLTY